MLDIIDNLNDSDLPVLVSFEVVNMFLSIENESGIKAVKKVLNDRESKNSPTECILEALRLCLECNNSAFNDKNFIQLMVQLKGLTCHAHRDIVTLLWLILTTELKIALSNPVWKRFRDEVFSVWTHNINTLPA